MSTNLVASVGQLASDVLEGIANAVVGQASTLRDGTEHRGVELPRDLYAHREAQTEWWYYTGHMQTTSGRKFGFELVFFKRRTDLDRFGVVPLRLIANPLYLAHFAVTDESRRRFRYSHRKSTGGALDLPARASEEYFYLRLGNWTMCEAHGAHALRATLGGDLIFEAALKSTKPAALNGHEGVGVSFKDENEASRYFSFTRMEAEGDITWNGETEHFKGSAWMDREFGTWRTTDNQKGWDWFSIQLATGAELMVYHLRDSRNRPSPFSSGTFVDERGRSTHLRREDFTLEASAFWQSPRTNAVYPGGWKLSVPRFQLELSIEPVLKDQELDTRGTTMIVYWEGACRVLGLHQGRQTEGRAYVELVGYDRSHEQPSLSAFLFGGALDLRWRSIFG
ncbi:MAG TPA: lipocalin family protein [Pyrinomonadaceae bacterium]|jgi:predicted secreted hydrolase|nr:lipocalin family protein [Pyrinomonadaceae bacterium]